MYMYIRFQKKSNKNTYIEINGFQFNFSINASKIQKYFSDGFKQFKNVVSFLNSLSPSLYKYINLFV